MIPLQGSELRISSRDYLLYRRCPRSFHLRLTGAPVPAYSPSDELYPVRPERARVQEVARRRFPQGRPAESTAGTDETLFGARCYYEPFEATADVWLPQKPTGMAAVLVREGTSIKESYLREAAFLDYCFSGCGSRPERIFVYHVNKSYERAGDIDLDEFFVVRDVTRRVRRLADETCGELEKLRDELEEDPALSRYRDQPCARPHGCPLCSADLPRVDTDHVSTLHRGGQLVRELMEDGITSIADIPVERLAHRRQEIQQKTLIEGQPHVDATALRRFLGRLSYPLHYLDFEATSSAIPPFDRVRPWEHVPYLYSLHRQDADGTLSRTSHMMEPGVDGRREMVAHLAADARGEGSVIVYSAGFERGILRRLAEVAPEFHDDLISMTERIVDLLEPFNEFLFYHHEQRGKVSLKTVLPVLTDQDYSSEAVQDGYTANLVYRYLSERADERTAERDRLLADLVSYCAMDTLAMVHIVRELQQLAHEETG